MSAGTFIFNELVTGSSSGTTAKVRSWNSVTNELVVSNVSGSFAKGETIVGYASSASYKVRFVTIDANTDGYSSNDDIQIEGEQILDFTESNPFGTP